MKVHLVGQVDCLVKSSSVLTFLYRDLGMG